MKYPLLIFLTIALLEVIRHWYLITKKNISPNKALSFVLRVAVAGSVFYFFEWRYPAFPVAMIYLFSGWWIHDYILNIFRGIKPIWKLNKTGFLDQLQNKYPNAWVWFVWKSILAGLFLGMYFINEW